MPKTYTITAENSQELRELMSKSENARYYKKLQAVALRGEGKNNREIASITGYHPAYVSELVSIFCNSGVSALLQDGRKGGNNRNMSDEEAKAFISQFEKSAKSGKILTVSDIAAAYDKVTGKEHESKSTVYYLLHKLGWRRIKPQTEHPGKADDEAIDASKKLKKFTKS